MVEYGRKWEIKTAEDYRLAVETLENDEWIAMMGEGVEMFRREMAEIRRQRADIDTQARKQGII